MSIQKFGANFVYPKTINFESLKKPVDKSMDDLLKSVDEASKKIAKSEKIKSDVLTLGACSLGVGTSLAAAKIYQLKTGKPAGAPGSIAHVYTNDKLDSKLSTAVEQTKEGVKDLLTLGGITAGAATAGSLAVGNSTKVANAFKKLTSKVGNVLSDIVIQSKGKSIADIIKATPAFQKFGSLPLPARAGIVAGVAALTLISPFVLAVSAAKSGYIEGKHEVK